MAAVMEILNLCDASALPLEVRRPQQPACVGCRAVGELYVSLTSSTYLLVLQERPDGTLVLEPIAKCFEGAAEPRSIVCAACWLAFAVDEGIRIELARVFR